MPRPPAARATWTDRWRRRGALSPGAWSLAGCLLAGCLLAGCGARPPLMSTAPSDEDWEAELGAGGAQTDPEDDREHAAQTHRDPAGRRDPGPAKAPAGVTLPAAAVQVPGASPAALGAPATPDRPPDGPALAAPLRVPGADLAAAVDALGLAEVRAAHAHLSACCPESVEARAWLALRACRLQAHARRFAGAAADCAQAQADAQTLDPAAGGAVAQAAASTQRRLESRAHTRPGRVGVLLPLTGPYGRLGRWAHQAIEQARREAPHLEWVVADTGGEARAAAAAVERLVRTEGVVAIVGPIGHLEGEAAAAAAEDLEVPLLSLSGAEGIARQGTFVFQHRQPLAAQAEAVAHYACDHLRLRRFAILYADAEHGRALMRRFWETVTACGGVVYGVEALPLTGTRFDTAIKKIIGRHPLSGGRPDHHWKALNRKSKDPGQHLAPRVDFDAVFIADGPRAGFVLPQLRDWDVEVRTAPGLDAERLAARYGGKAPPLVQVLGPAGFDDATFFRRAGPEADNAVFALGFRPAGAVGQAFAQRFAEATGRAPDALAAHAYDAARLLGLLTEGQPDRGTVRRRLLELSEYTGVFGSTRFDAEGRVVVPVAVGTYSHALHEVMALTEGEAGRAVGLHGPGDLEADEAPTFEGQTEDDEAPTIFVDGTDGPRPPPPRRRR